MNNLSGMESGTSTGIAARASLGRWHPPIKRGQASTATPDRTCENP